MPVPPERNHQAPFGRQAVSFPLCPRLCLLSGISITRSAVDMPSAPRRVSPSLDCPSQTSLGLLSRSFPKGGVKMVPITSDGLEAPNEGALMTASSFSCRMGNLAFHPDVTSRLCLVGSAVCLMSSCRLSERDAHRFGPLSRAEC